MTDPNYNAGFVRDPTTGALVTSGGGGGGGGVTQVSDGAITTRLLTVNADGSLNVNTTIVEQATAASGAANPSVFKVIAGSDGTLARPIKTDTSGVLQADLAAPIPTGSNTIGATNQGTANTAANAWPNKLTDGTNVAAVKAASTAPAATDPALVVVMSPNAPITSVAGTVTANQGTANTAANAWPQKLTDGTNVAAVKAASTAPVASDPALVVATSPNSPAQPVTGTFWQATQPVSGTFWQATQPVSGTVTANQGTANTAANAWPHKLTDGTNTAAVKAASTAAAAADPAAVVSLSPNSPVAFSADVVNSATITASGQTVAVTVPPGGRSVHFYASGSPFSAGTVIQFEGTYDGTTWIALGAIFRSGITPTVGTSLAGAGFGVLQWEANCAGLAQVRGRCSAFTALDVPVLSVRVSQADIGNQGGLPQIVASPAAAGNAVLGNPVRIGGSDGTNVQDVKVTTKATQGAHGVAVQNLRDSGRVGITISGYQVAGTITTETAMSLVKQADGVAVAAATSYTVTTGKRLRLQQLMAQYKQNAAAASNQKIAVRYASTAPTNASPVIAYLDLESTSATSGTMVGPYFFDFPDGFEIPATFVVSVFNLASAATNLVTVTLLGYEY